MIPFERFTLSNGLRVVVNTDVRTPLVAMSLMYDVGSRDEDVSATGFAHLFEHLMFGGSVNVPNFDTPLQLAGGVSNAYTSSDVTCFYCVLPAENVETAFWLESDRMLSLAFTPKSLEVQRKVVIEEFKQTHLNAPYGDVSHLLLDLAYKVHPYRWPTIGLEVQHIEQATMEQVREFFFAHYAPNNAVLALSGNITAERAAELAEKWFAPVPRRQVMSRHLPQEPAQAGLRASEVHRDVPADAVFMAFHMCDRLGADYPICDIISDVLSNGRSARFPIRLVAQKQLFSSAEASVLGSVDPGLLMVSGMLNPGVTFEQAEEAIWTELADLRTVTAEEVLKVQNKFVAGITFEEISAHARSLTLAEFELLGDAHMANARESRQRRVSHQDVIRCAAEILRPENCSILRYHANA